jgi:uncharacterized protein (DUF924 family)
MESTSAQPGERAATPERADEILSFWFGRDRGAPEPREIWFRSTRAFDEEIARLFLNDCRRAAAGEDDDWMSTPRGCVALILLLDQFPRNLFRGTAGAFGTDAKARLAAWKALERGYDRQVPELWRWFLYLPFEHSESLEDQRLAVRLFEALPPDPWNHAALEFARGHLAIIERFGRFPHRNAALGRQSTPDEEKFLELPGSSF